MAYYESIWIARQDISTQQVEELAGQLSQILSDRGGQVASQEYWGLKNLAYRIKKNRKGHYVLFNLDAPAEAVQEYERVMRLNEDVVRYLTVRVPELSSEPSAMLRDRGERDRGRGGRGGGRYGDRDRGDRGGDRGDRGGDRGDRGGDRGERRERREGAE